ncbi:MAG: 1,4-alpha-glucan branching enzyme, partial [Mycobacterium sp.]|nr:1,4-alpha-glucan branching enzyme [Mycobacterium sp.]
MTRDLGSRHLAPDTGDLGRLIGGMHFDPHSILGAHEYAEHTVIRTLRPHAVEVVALIGGRRYPMTHLSEGLFAVALDFTNLVDYR